MTAVLIVLGLIAIVVGILGTIYPALPGLGLMFGGAWLLGYAGDYQVFGSGTLTFLAIVAVFGTAMDYVAGALGAILLYSRPVARPVGRRGHRRIYRTQRHLAGRQGRYRYVYRFYHRYRGQNRLRLDHCTDHPVCLVSLVVLRQNIKGRLNFKHSDGLFISLFICRSRICTFYRCHMGKDRCGPLFRLRGVRFAVY